MRYYWLDPFVGLLMGIGLEFTAAIITSLVLYLMVIPTLIVGLPIFMVSEWWSLRQERKDLIQA